MMFRFKALQKMREPDELDSPSLLAAPRGWIAAFVIGFVMAGAAVWAFVGSIPITVAAPGLLTYPNGTATVASPIGGTVTDVLVHPGQHVNAGDRIAAVDSNSDPDDGITSPFTGLVVGLSITQAQILNRGDPVVTVERVDYPDESLIAMLFVPEHSVQGVRPGSAVNLAVSTAAAAQFGLLQGTVSSVSEFPLTSGQVSALVGGDLAARDYTSTSPPHLVLIELTRDPATPSGFAWSTASGPPGQLRSQVLVQATVEIGSDPPIRMFFGR